MTYRIGVLDLETTGLSQEKGHRIIEVGFGMLKTENGATFERIGTTICKRLNPQRDIDPGAQAVHGISITELAHCETWKSFAPKVGKLFRACDMIVAHNASFDLPFIGGEFVRESVDFGDPEIFCTMEAGRFATAMGKVPNLGVLCWSLDVPYDADKAHSAAYDVDRTIECLLKGLAQGHYRIPALDLLSDMKLAS